MTTQFYICDETNDCSGKEIVCIFDRGSCHIECNAPNVCKDTIMRVGTPTTLAVKCSVNNSCPNANISDAVRVEGYGKYALQSVTVNCLKDSSCQIICDDQHTCLNATIKGTDTTEVDIKCNAYQSCHNIDLYCPPSGANYFFCEIHGNIDELYDIHTDFNIYGPNGWADIWFDNYNAYVQGGNFYCGGPDSWGFFDGNSTEGYTCGIEYGLWDCKDPTSPCTDQAYFADNREYFIINNDETDLNDTFLYCEEFDDSVIYPVSMWSSCNLICRGDNTCKNVEFTCPSTKKQCNVICTGVNSCNGLILNDVLMTNRFSNSDINVLCGNDNACQNSYIAPPERMQSLTIYRVNLFGENNLINSLINCSSVPRYTTCDIRCQNDLSCKSGTVTSTGGYSKFVDIDIQCNGNVNSCSDMTVHCSKYGNCRMRGLSVDENRNFHIFSRESWEHVDLDEWYNKLVVGDGNIMHCGVGYGKEYNNTCVVDNNWNCSCLVYPTMSPNEQPTKLPTGSPVAVVITTAETFNPTMSPSEQPTKSPSEQPTKSPTTPTDTVEEKWYVVAVVFIILFIIVGLVLMYFAYLLYYADEKATEVTSYGQVQSSEIEAGNLNTVTEEN